MLVRVFRCGDLNRQAIEFFVKPHTQRADIYPNYFDFRIQSERNHLQGRRVGVRFMFWRLHGILKQKNKKTKLTGYGLKQCKHTSYDTQLSLIDGYFVTKWKHVIVPPEAIKTSKL